MAQTESLTLALKQSLKEQGQTYADLAAGINLSEASIKRLFSEQSFSLKRLDEICDWLNIEISDLVRKAEANLDMISEFTARNNSSLKTLVTEHKVDLRPYPKDVIDALRAASYEVLEEVAANDPQSQKVYDSFKAFLESVSKWHDVSERAFINARADD